MWEIRGGYTAGDEHTHERGKETIKEREGGRYRAHGELLGRRHTDEEASRDDRRTDAHPEGGRGAAVQRDDGDGEGEDEPAGDLIERGLDVAEAEGVEHEARGVDDDERDELSGGGELEGGERDGGTAERREV